MMATDDLPVSWRAAFGPVWTSLLKAVLGSSVRSTLERLMPLNVNAVLWELWACLAGHVLERIHNIKGVEGLIREVPHFITKELALWKVDLKKRIKKWRRARKTRQQQQQQQQRRQVTSTYTAWPYTPHAYQVHSNTHTLGIPVYRWIPAGSPPL